jgi:hypothetical protein
MLWNLNYSLERYAQYRSIKDFIVQLIFFRHNARVIADFEHRMGMTIYYATNGQMSNSYYSIESMKSEIEDTQTKEYFRGYDDCKTDYDIKD